MQNPFSLIARSFSEICFCNFSIAWSVTSSNLFNCCCSISSQQTPDRATLLITSPVHAKLPILHHPVQFFFFYRLLFCGYLILQFFNLIASLVLIASKRFQFTVCRFLVHRKGFHFLRTFFCKARSSALNLSRCKPDRKDVSFSNILQL